MKFNAEAAGVIAALVFPSYSIACDSCYGPANVAEHVRHVKRIQPGAPEAVYGPTRPLEWGQLNFMHTVGSPSKLRVGGCSLILTIDTAT